MCAFASRSFNVERGRPLGQWDLLGDELSLDIILWLEPSFPPCAPSLSLSFSFTPSFSFARPLCSARRMSKCFLRPGTARRWVKEWVCSKWKKNPKQNNYFILLFLWPFRNTGLFPERLCKWKYWSVKNRLYHKHTSLGLNAALREAQDTTLWFHDSFHNLTLYVSTSHHTNTGKYYLCLYTVPGTLEGNQPSNIWFSNRYLPNKAERLL